MASSDSSSSPTLPIPPLPNVSNFLTISLVPIVDGTSQCPAAFFKNSDVNITDTVNPALRPGFSRMPLRHGVLLNPGLKGQIDGVK
ncbi:hypothetical protein ACFX2G_037267 [Malus domestica]